MPIDLTMNRRDFCRTAATTALVTAAFGSSFLSLMPVPAIAETVPMTELMAPQPLPDMVLGSKSAPVIVVEYASMTCPHCAHFDETAYPKIKKNYIDTGKVRWILREFPLDPLAAAAFMLARCAADGSPPKYYDMVNTLFHQQDTWAIEKPIPPLLSIAKQAGMTETKFKACLSDQKMLDKIQAERQEAINKFKVNATPTFYIDGIKHEGALEYDQFAKILDAQLKGNKGK
ncbi:MAG TPA: DsbA family protein [Pseudolabrys sp.]|nr:DsbA family protein [Pseudolabrys sp.]